MSDYNEDRAHEMGFVPEDEDIVTEKEFSKMLRDRVYFEPRRKPVTEDWLMAQEDLRRAACRDLDRSYSEHIMNAIGFGFVLLVILGASCALLAGVAWASQWLYRALIG